MFITPSFKKSLIVEQFQGNYLKPFVWWRFRCRRRRGFVNSLILGSLRNHDDDGNGDVTEQKV